MKFGISDQTSEHARETRTETANENATKRILQRPRPVAGAGMMAGTRLSAQDAPARGGGAPKPPTYSPKMEMLWKSPDRYPNALEASPEGLWVGDQVSERINLLDWKTGKVLEDFVGEAHNTSGLAVGGGFHLDRLQRCRALRHNLREFKRPFDKNYGEIVKLDMKGKQVKGYRTPWGGVHGTFYHKQTDKLWAVAPGLGFLAEMDPKDDLRISRMLQIRMNVPHGLDFYDGSFWIIDGADRLVQRIDPESWPRAGNLGVRAGRSGSARHVHLRQPRVLHGCGPRRRTQAQRGHQAADDLPVPADAD